MASAAAVKWEDKIPPPQRPDAKGGSGLVTRVFLREIGAEMLATISDDYMIEGLVLITDGSAPAASILLPGPDGQVVARIGWTPSEPGTAFLEELVFPLAGALLVAGALLLLIVSRVRASVQRTLDAHRALQHRTRELREARDEAKRANEAKSEFLAQMSHDLRTPLNAILGFSEVIALQTFGTGGQATERYRDYARQIHAGGAHLRSLIDSILDVTRLDSGRYMITPAPIALDDVVHDCLALLRDGIEEKALSVDTPASALRVMADRSGLEQVLLNLIGNAVKYSGSGDRIRVTAKSSGEGAVISVADTGRGMAPEEVAHAFDLFTRGIPGHRQHPGDGSRPQHRQAHRGAARRAGVDRLRARPGDHGDLHGPARDPGGGTASPGGVGGIGPLAGRAIRQRNIAAKRRICYSFPNRAGT
jgi:signal transduction histidine kinase